MKREPEVATHVPERFSLYFGTIYGDLVIRMHDQTTIQHDVLSWLSRNGLLAELQDEGPDAVATGE